MNRLSNRLLHIAAQVQPADTLADIGCDHGYLPIYLLKSGCIRHAIAMDIGEGPLQRAKEHIAEEQLGNYIQTRLSNGLERLQPGEADAVVIAGMGGSLIVDILTRGKAVVDHLEQLVIEPQSELAGVRCFLRKQNYFVEQEDYVLEDGKFYPILRILPKQPSDDETLARQCGLDISVTDAYGYRLLQAAHPVLAEYLKKEHDQCEQILRGLPDGQSGGDRIARRRMDLTAQLLLTHHPLIFSPLKQINTDQFISARVVELLRTGMSCYAMHTNYDAARMGVLAAQRLGIPAEAPLGDLFERGGCQYGIGSVGDTDNPLTLADLGAQVKDRFGLQTVKIFGDLSGQVQRVAMCPGAGKSMIPDALAQGAQVLITGDIDHHSGIDAVAQGLSIIDAGHYGIEHIFISDMQQYLNRELPQIEAVAQERRDPFVVI